MKYRLVDLRPEVKCFAQEMEKILTANDYKGGWQSMSMNELWEKMKEEVKEVLDVLKLLNLVESKSDIIKAIGGRESMGKVRTLLLKECVDVANIAMMIGDNFGNLEVQEMIEVEDALFEKEQLAIQKRELELTTTLPNEIRSFLHSTASAIETKRGPDGNYSSTTDAAIVAFVKKMMESEVEKLKGKERIE